MVNLILDTDMGPDCDDAGALALLHVLSRQRPVNLLAVTHCTSSPYGCGCIDAINRAYDCTTAIGTLKKPDFLVGEQYEKYNKYISEHYDNAYRNREDQPDAQAVLRKTLEDAADGSVTVVAIGPLTNLALLVGDEQGRMLVRRKVKQLISMAGGYDAPEWNVVVDIPSAQTVFRQWDTPIVLSPYETGLSIITGADFGTLADDHPLPMAYKLHSPQGRMSWDLTAVWFAIMGEEPFFSLSDPLHVDFMDDGLSVFAPDPNGRFRTLDCKMDPEQIGREIDNLW